MFTIVGTKPIETTVDVILGYRTKIELRWWEDRCVERLTCGTLSTAGAGRSRVWVILEKNREKHQWGHFSLRSACQESFLHPDMKEWCCSADPSLTFWASSGFSAAFLLGETRSLKSEHTEGSGHITASSAGPHGTALCGTLTFVPTVRSSPPSGPRCPRSSGWLRFWLPKMKMKMSRPQTEVKREHVRGEPFMEEAKIKLGGSLSGRVAVWPRQSWRPDPSVPGRRPPDCLLLPPVTEEAEQMPLLTVAVGPVVAEEEEDRPCLPGEERQVGPQRGQQGGLGTENLEAREDGFTSMLSRISKHVCVENRHMLCFSNLSWRSAAPSAPASAAVPSFAWRGQQKQNQSKRQNFLKWRNPQNHIKQLIWFLKETKYSYFSFKKS